jgi:Flp pilus assembly protein TadD
MSKPFRLGASASAIVLASMISGCAAPQQATGFGGVRGDVGLATRALAALNSNDVPLAIDLGERAVEKSPNDAGFRALLGNAYFAAGRFNSAEMAFKDSLTLYPTQPHVVLKLALVQIALGKRDEAVRLLQSDQAAIDPANYGLAIALSGRPDEAISVLEPAARQPGADARIRQNLALAYALAGDWTEARVVAAQDVASDQLDARIQHWMQLANPSKPSDQVAALTGVTPAPSDQGQPVRLALRNTDTMLAEAAPAPGTAPLAQSAASPQPQVAEAAPSMAPPVMPAASITVPLPEAKPALAQAEPMKSSAASITVPLPEAKPVVAEADSPSSSPMAVLTAAAEKVSSVVESFLPEKPAPVTKPAKVRTAKASRGNPDAIMQLGSYRTPQQVTAGWDRLTTRYPELRNYLPMRARFDSAKGTFWRLSVQGFESQRAAIARCDELKDNGGQCFVRGFAGDKPVEIASR